MYIQRERDLRRQNNNEVRHFQEDEQLGETKNENLSNLKRRIHQCRLSEED
jgi:hypothetical protein